SKPCRVRKTSSALSSTRRMWIGRSEIIKRLTRSFLSRLVWEGEREHATGAGFGLDPDGTTVAVHDATTDREPDARAWVGVLRVEAPEDLEHPLVVLRRDADAVV